MKKYIKRTRFGLLGSPGTLRLQLPEAETPNRGFPKSGYHFGGPYNVDYGYLDYFGAPACKETTES